jgi:hypothetical protein
MKFIEFPVPDGTIVPSDLIESVITVTTTTTQMNMSYGGRFVIRHEAPLEADGVVEAIYDAMTAKPGARATMVRNPIRVAQELGSIDGNQFIVTRQDMVDFVGLAYAPPVTENPAIFEFTGTKAQLPIQVVGTYEYTVDWGDGSAKEDFSGVAASHTYATAGTYETKVTGLYPGIAFGAIDNGAVLTDVISWGDQVYESFANAFEGINSINGTSNGTWSVRTSPDLTACTGFERCFKDAIGLDLGFSAGSGRIGNWDTSFVNNFEECFAYSVVTASQNAPTIGSWDMGNAINLKGMFENVTWSSLGIGGWNFGVAQDFRRMFSGAANYNEDLNNWGSFGSTTATVTNMKGMFSGAASFNSDLNRWNVSNVLDMDNMFREATDFNGNITRGNISGWLPSSCTTMSGMFKDAVSFNRTIGAWDVSSVGDMTEMFRGAFLFDQELNDWDVSNVTIMQSMFNQALVFNRPLNNWDVSSVDSFSFMFNLAVLFDQDLGDWDISNANNLVGFNANNNGGFSTASYDLTLTGWSNTLVAAYPNPNDYIPNININFSQTQYSAATSTSRDLLTNARPNGYGWTISDGGQV